MNKEKISQYLGAVWQRSVSSTFSVSSRKLKSAVWQTAEKKNFKKFEKIPITKEK